MIDQAQLQQFISRIPLLNLAEWQHPIGNESNEVLLEWAEALEMELARHELVQLSKLEDSAQIEAALIAFFKERWDRIKESDLCYPHRSDSLINMLCLEIALILANGDRTKAYQLLMHTLQVTEDIYHCNLGEYDFGSFVMSDDNSRAIVVYGALEMAREDGILKHTSLLPGKLDLALTPAETARVVSHSEQAKKTYDAIWRFCHVDCQGSHLAKLKLLIRGLRSGGKRGSRGFYLVDNLPAPDQLKVFYDTYVFVTSTQELIYVRRNGAVEKVELKRPAEEFKRLLIGKKAERGAILAASEFQDYIKLEGDSGRGSEFKAGDDANVAIAAYYDYYIALNREERRALRVLRADYYAVGYYLDVLFNPNYLTISEEDQPVTYCVEIIAKELDDILFKNMNVPWFSSVDLQAKRDNITGLLNELESNQPARKIIGYSLKEKDKQLRYLRKAFLLFSAHPEKMDLRHLKRLFHPNSPVLFERVKRDCNVQVLLTNQYFSERHLFFYPDFVESVAFHLRIYSRLQETSTADQLFQLQPFFKYGLGYIDDILRFSADERAFLTQRAISGELDHFLNFYELTLHDLADWSVNVRKVLFELGEQDFKQMEIYYDNLQRIAQLYRQPIDDIININRDLQEKLFLSADVMRDILSTQTISLHEVLHFISEVDLNDLPNRALLFQQTIQLNEFNKLDVSIKRWLLENHNVAVYLMRDLTISLKWLKELFKKETPLRMLKESVLSLCGEMEKISWELLPKNTDAIQRDLCAFYRVSAETFRCLENSPLALRQLLSELNISGSLKPAAEQFYNYCLARKKYHPEQFDSVFHGELYDLTYSSLRNLDAIIEEVMRLEERDVCQTVVKQLKILARHAYDPVDRPLREEYHLLQSGKALIDLVREMSRLIKQVQQNVKHQFLVRHFKTKIVSFAEDQTLSYDERRGMIEKEWRMVNKIMELSNRILITMDADLPDENNRAFREGIDECYESYALHGDPEICLANLLILAQRLNRVSEVACGKTVFHFFTEAGSATEFVRSTLTQ